MPNPGYDLSVLEQQVMLALLRDHPNGYGVSVFNEIELRTGRRVPLPSIYAALDRLASKGLLTPREGEPTPERGGRRKLYFELTVAGRGALSKSINDMDALRLGVDVGGEACGAR